MSAEQPSLRSSSGWADRLGLLPVPLLPCRNLGYVMLNGDRGNFCLSFGEVVEGAQSVAWSCDVGHHLEVESDNVVLRRWDGTQPETIPISHIDHDLERFRRYLEDGDPRLVDTVVGHVLRVLYVLRDVLGDDTSGEVSILGLLLAVAALYDGTDPKKVDLNRWNMVGSEKAVGAIGNPTWLNIMNILRLPTQSGLTIQAPLLLRHAAGRLFQEASYRVSLPSQLSLPGVEQGKQLTPRALSAVGQFFTPTPLARTVVEQALSLIPLDAPNVTILDPACGSGELLRETVRQLSLRASIPRIKLIGFDISPLACAMTNFVLRAEQIQNPDLEITVDVCEKDSLAEKWPAVDMIVMNPPFISYQDMTDDQRTRLARTLGYKSLPNRFDASMIFVAKACETLQSGGVLATLVPSSLLSAKSSDWLRENFLSSLSPRLVAGLGNQYAFKNVIVDANIYVGVRDGISSEVQFVWSDHRSSSMMSALRTLRRHPAYDFEEIGGAYSLYRRPAKSTERLVPRQLSALQAFERVRNLDAVKNYFEVHQGVRTGDNRAFVVDEQEFKTLPRGERRFFVPALVNASILDGRIVNRRFLFYPYGDSVFESQADLRNKVPTFFKSHLLPRREALLTRVRVDPKRWWLLSEPRIDLASKKPKLVSTFFGGSGSFAWDAAGEHIVVQGHSWLPRPEFRDEFSENAASAYVALLNSDEFEKLVRARASQVAGGQFDLSKRYVDDVPLPNLFEGEDGIGWLPTDLYDLLIQLGKKMTAGKAYDRVTLNETAAEVLNLASQAIRKQ
jgi:adenine-specific DNA-methyltransferase